MKFCIGIISYLPDKIRDERLEKIKSLLNECSLYFPSIDIIIISQNYKDYFPEVNSNKIILYSYKNKLGILNARKKLREIFINSDYDYLIMMDDDIKLTGNPTENNLIKIVEEEPSSFACFDWDFGQLDLFVISKSLFERVTYPDLDPGAGGIFEDIYISQICKHLCPTYIDISKININRKIKPGQSTWWNNKNYNLKKMVSDTNRLIEHDLKYKYKI